MAPFLESLQPTLALLGLATVVATAAWLVADPRWRHQDDLLQFALRATGQMLFISAMAALALWFFATSGVLILGIGLFVAWLVFLQSRASGRRALVGLLAAAAEGSMPLAPAVEALADESPGRLGGRLDGLAGRLRSGVALPEALAGTRRVASPLLAAAAAIGQQCGCLPEALRQQSREQAEELRLMERVVSRLWYVVLVLNFTWLTMAYMVWRILPKLQRIFDDFGIQLEPLGASLWGLFMSPSMLVALTYLSLPLALIALTFTLGLMWNPSMPWPVTAICWRFPLRGVLELMSLAVGRGMPISPALATVGDHLPQGRLRKRLRQVAVEVVEGEPFEQAMRRQGLLTAAQAGVLQAAQRAGNLPWAMREIGQTVGRREAQRLQWLLNALSILLLGFVALLVLMLALAVFLLLVQLMSELQ